MSRRILAVASGGGHWADLCRIYPVFEGFDVAFVSVSQNYAGDVKDHRFYVMQDLSRLDMWRLVFLIPQLVRIIRKERPALVITTGSAPALFALGVAKLLNGSKTIWIDPVANVDKMSLSGSLAKYIADVWLTQWPGLQKDTGPMYLGAVL